MDYEVPTTLVGAMAVAVSALTVVVVVLFKLYVSRNKSAEYVIAAKDATVAKERQEWAVERERIDGEHELEFEKLRADAEKRVRESAESYASELAEMNDKFMTREDSIRRDFGDRIERIASEASKSAQAQNDVLSKIYDRFVGPRRGRSPGG